MKKYRPGDTVPMTCGYKPYNKFGDSLSRDTMFLEEGDTFPPTQQSGGFYVMDMRGE